VGLLLDQFRSIFSRGSSAREPEETSAERRARTRANPREGSCVLVIDDSPTILKVLKRFLESARCVVLEAPDARVGLELALTQKPALIFLDIVMPGINGFAALRALRKNPRTKDTPVIMMSGNEQATAQFFGAHIGADDFMKKPFSRFEVFARIERLLDENQTPRRHQTETAAAPVPAKEPSKAPTQGINGQAQAAQQVHQPHQQPPHQQPQPAPAVMKPAPAAVNAAEAIAPSAVPTPFPQLTALTTESAPEPVVPVLPTTATATPEAGFSFSFLAPTAQTQAPPAAPPAPSAAPQALSQQDLLAQIAALAQRAQSDPSVFSALSALSAQFVARNRQGAEASVPVRQ
jgi:twitching motility two-component system response regulator PilH